MIIDECFRWAHPLGWCAALMSEQGHNSGNWKVNSRNWKGLDLKVKEKSLKPKNEIWIRKIYKMKIKNLEFIQNTIKMMFIF